MSKVKVQKGDVLTFALAGKVGGTPAKIGSIVGVYESSSDDQDRVAVDTRGVFKLPTLADGTDIIIGDQVYIKADETLTSTAAGNTLFGKALQGVSNGDTSEIEIKVG